MSNYQLSAELKNKPTADTIRSEEKRKVFVGMSGGVDSSVSAYLLKGAGYDVTGVFMRCYNIDGCAEKDAEDARRVAEKIKIPFYVWDFEEEYKKKVVEYMIADYAAGRTPNPDVACNREIKFGLFLKRALSSGADYIATGHYARLRREETRNKKQETKSSQIVYKLCEGKDKNKDQSYFLWTLNQKDLKHCLFPLGELLKSEVREIAKKAGLPTANKKDSQGICFLGQVDLKDFLSSYIPKKKGDIIDINGKKIGEHDGASFYTVGQRKGLNLGEKNLGGGAEKTEPHYVAEIDTKNNLVIVAEGSDNSALYKKQVELEGVNFVNLRPENWKSQKIFARIRYRQPLFGVYFKEKSSGKFSLDFIKSQKFVALGQSAVFYAEDGELLGGGIIKLVV